MNAFIQDSLTNVAETQTPEIAVPSGLFDRARRTHRRRRLAGLVGAVVIVIITGWSVSIDARPQPAAEDQIDGMPAQLVEAPKWTASIEHAPIRRALAAFDLNTYDTEYEVVAGEARGTPRFNGITLVGPADEYRTFDPTRLGGKWSGVLKLSPDGRYLLTGHGDRTQLLEIATGQARMLDAGAPLAWSPDSKQAIFVHYDNPENSSPVSGQIRILDMPSGTTIWAITLEPGPLPRSVDAIMSDDNSTLVLKRHGDLFAYSSGGTLIWQRTTDTSSFLGQRSFTLDGKTFALGQGSICLYSSVTGMANECVGYQQMLPRMSDKPHNYLTPVIVGWEDDLPLVRFTDGVIRLTAIPQWLLKAPQDTRDLQLATDRVQWSSREPGPPDPGPAFDRYRPIINIASIGALVLALVAVAVWWRRHRRGNRGYPKASPANSYGAL